MHTADDIKPGVIQRYIRQAKSHVDDGREIRADRSRPIVVPVELKNALRRQKGATAAFRKLRPGQRRDYTDYVSDAKRDETKQRRIEKILPMIQRGVGLNEKYR